jgi:hypothetical protein
MYYLGFLKRDMRHVVVFRAIVKPKPGDYTYFLKVIGPYITEQEARNDLRHMRGYRENPATSERQRKFMCAELGRLRSGKRTQTTMTEKQVRDFCRKKNPAKYLSDRQALALTKRVMAAGKKLLRHERSEIRRNPEEQKHVDKFIEHMKTLEKYVVGSKPYIEALAKAYEHVQVAKRGR